MTAVLAARAAGELVAVAERFHTSDRWPGKLDEWDAALRHADATLAALARSLAVEAPAHRIGGTWVNDERRRLGARLVRELAAGGYREAADQLRAALVVGGWL